MTVTIKEVAEAAQVSPSTVSRVLAGNPRISDETKKKVMKAVKVLNYHPNAIARSLANKSTNTLGVILPSSNEDLFRNPFFIQALTGISIYAKKVGYYIMYTYSRSEEEEINIIDNYYNSKLVDGMILLTSRQEDKTIEHIKEIGLPFAVIGKTDDIDHDLWTDNDNFKAMREVVKHFIEKGHSNIGFVGGPLNMRMSRDRLEGYISALQENNIEIKKEYIIEMPEFTEECGYSACEKLILNEELSCIVTTDDLLAFGVLKYFKENKSRRMTVSGFNNTPLAEYQSPPLTSVNINAHELGYNAAKLLIGALKGNLEEKNYIIVDTEIVRR
ncbi:MAG: LacI family DNA-binding transcriptional regulator [Clostridiaceae bacterium]